jgi:transcriptional regulator with XRE-family HTH domain
MNELQPDIIKQDNIVVLEDTMAHQLDDEVLLDENTIILAAGDVYDKIDMEMIQKAFKAYGKSYQKLSDKIGISKEAIYKFLKKKSKSPSAYLLITLCKELGVSLDDMCGIRKAEIPAADQDIAELKEAVKAMQKALDTLSKELHSNYITDSNNY